METCRYLLFVYFRDEVIMAFLYPAGTWPHIPLWATFTFRASVFIFCLVVELTQIGLFGKFPI